MTTRVHRQEEHPASSGALPRQSRSSSCAGGVGGVRAGAGTGTERQGATRTRLEARAREDSATPSFLGSRRKKQGDRYLKTVRQILNILKRDVSLSRVFQRGRREGGEGRRGRLQSERTSGARAALSHHTVVASSDQNQNQNQIDSARPRQTGWIASLASS